MDSLGDRIKSYEKTFNMSLMKRVPVMVRVDGRAFHTMTRSLDKPFDNRLIDAMVNAAADVACHLQGFKAAYIQSDEVTFCITDYDTVDTQGWFGYDLSKIVSLSAAIMSVRFNKYYPLWKDNGGAVFDSRAFNVPQPDVINAFLWRAKDWERNSLQMYARNFFSHKELINKKQKDMHDMLHSIGKNWTVDLTGQQKNGTFIISCKDGDRRGFVTRTDIPARYMDINIAIGGLFV